MELPFSDPIDKSKPLADRMRPRDLDEFLGQTDVVGAGTLLRKALEQGELKQSLILWGPPGCGKTTLASIMANKLNCRFVTLSAVASGIAEVKRVIADAKKMRTADSKPLLLFIDEVHRFNKAQQDAFLPHIENGTIVFIGATTENPSFEVITPLLSRSRVLVLDVLEEAEVLVVLKRALADKERGLGEVDVKTDDEVLSYLARVAQGDARVALNALDYAASVVARTDDRVLTQRHIEDALQRPLVTTDKSGESHYNLISALHKSLRGGDVDASLYWLARMCEAGEDPLFIVRRLVVFASEDVGNADPQALVVATAAKDAVEFLGYPECKLPLAQAVTYLALAHKSNASYRGYKSAAKAVHDNPPYAVPLHIRNAPTRLMKDLRYGKDYKYPHDYPDAFVLENYLPDELKKSRFYEPQETGYEADLKKRRDDFRKKQKRD